MQGKHSSKGNQIKFQENGDWYKADFLGYEGAAEFVVSYMLQNSTITNFAEYTLCDIPVSGSVLTGCKSKNFLGEGENLITLQRLFLAECGKSVEQYLKGRTLEDKIKTLISTVENITGLAEFKQYLLETLTLDMITLNEDRHWHNLAVLKTREGYRICPIFDNGAAYLSDTRYDYPLSDNVFGLINSVDAKPFDRDFQKQVEVCENVVGSCVTFSVPEMLPDDVCKELRSYYSEDIVRRICEVYQHQQYVYREYFRKPDTNCEITCAERLQKINQF